MNPELKELAERAGLSKAINHPSCQMWEGLDAELAEFAALIADFLAKQCVSEYDIVRIRNQAKQWRGSNGGN